MKRTAKNFLLIISVFFFIGCGSVEENNWPQFRGINSLGIAPENATPPLELNPDKNLAWKIPLASGLSSPCISEDRIFLTGFNPSDSALITYCIDRRKGSLLWEKKVFPDSLEDVHTIGNPAAATPATDGLAVYVYFGSYGVLCYDFKGTLLWERRLPMLNAQYGSNASPIVHDSLLILNRIELMKPSVLVINCHNGETVWEHFLDVAPGTPLPFSVSQSTPVIWSNQVIIHRGFELVSFNLKDGSTKWTVEIVSTGVSTPVIMNNILFFNGFYNMGESKLYDKAPDFNMMLTRYDANRDKLINISEIPRELAFYRRPGMDISIPSWDTLYSVRDWAMQFDSSKDGALGEEEWNQFLKDQMNFIKEHGALAIKLDSADGSGQPVILWKVKEYVPEVPSLVVVDNRVFMVMNGGMLSCIDSKTGKVIYRERLGAPGAYLASPLYANGYIYFAAYNGKITVIKPGDKPNVIARSDLHESIGASPVALDKMLYIRTASGLYVFD